MRRAGAPRRSHGWLLTLAALGITASAWGAGQAATWKDIDGQPLPFQDEAAILQFMRTAEIESLASIALGVTDPRRAVLQQGSLRVRAVLRDYDETFEQLRLETEFYARLRDSFVFDVAAYELSKLLGFVRIPPVTFRHVGNAEVTLQIWLEGGMMESERVTNDLRPPSVARFREQMENMRVFDSLIGNIDRNAGNILIDDHWDIWLIDHSRSFMRNDDAKYLDNIQLCDRGLFARLKTLERDELAAVMSPPLTLSEVSWVLRRRDRVVAHIESLIAERGEDAVLFDSGS